METTSDQGRGFRRTKQPSRRRCFQAGGKRRVCLWAPVQDEPRSHGFQAKPAAGLQQRALPKRMNDGVSCVLDQVLNPIRKGAPKNNRSARRHRCQEAANNEGPQNTSVPPAAELSKRSLRVKDTRRERGVPQRDRDPKAESLRRSSEKEIRPSLRCDDIPPG